MCTRGDPCLARPRGDVTCFTSSSIFFILTSLETRCARSSSARIAANRLPEEVARKANEASSTAVVWAKTGGRRIAVAFEFSTCRTHHSVPLALHVAPRSSITIARFIKECIRCAKSSRVRLIGESLHGAHEHRIALHFSPRAGGQLLFRGRRRPLGSAAKARHNCLIDPRAHKSEQVCLLSRRSPCRIVRLRRLSMELPRPLRIATFQGVEGGQKEQVCAFGCRIASNDDACATSAGTHGHCIACERPSHGQS